ncbi:enoyl-CoA hydratase-related protein [Nocardia sp. NPDC005366]|uniref:enoyl-CoA hydratase-related protein n=1 Tax=Nocardia sp. NPDC005366 TaxID=3156878 RepID=UPI0033B060C4
MARRAIEGLAHCTVPVVTAVQGAAIGGGLCLVAVSDIVIAGDRARFGATEINVGLLGASAHLRRMVGPMRTRELYLTGRLVPAAEMAEYEGIAQVVPHERLYSVARDVAQEIASKSPLAVRLAKESLDRTESLPAHEAYRIEQDYTARLRKFDDSAEARAAFLEKRAPVWKWQ